MIHLTQGQVNPGIWTDCKLYFFMFFFGREYSSLLLVLMSLEKCFAVYFPFKSKTVCTVKTAKWATGIVGFILESYNCMYFVAVKSLVEPSGHCVFIERRYLVILTAVDSILYSYAPFSLIFMGNLAIVFRFMRAKCKNTNLAESTDQALAKSATRGTAMVVIVSVAFLLLTAPTAIAAASYRLYKYNLTQYLILKPQYQWYFICVVGSRFRGEILKIIDRNEKSRNCETHCHSIQTVVRTGSK